MQISSTEIDSNFEYVGPQLLWSFEIKWARLLLKYMKRSVTPNGAYFNFMQMESF
jgi:hypothetical protein